MEILYGIMKNFDIGARSVRNIALTSDESVKNKQKENYDKAKAALTELFPKLEKTINSTKGRELFGTMKDNYAATAQFMDKALPLGLANKKEEAANTIIRELLEAQGKFLTASEEFSGFAAEMSSKRSHESVDEVIRGRSLMTIFAGVAIVLGCLIAFFITRSVTKSIRRIVGGLTESYEQVAAASGQVSGSSQQLAEGASEQVASIEQTSSSLEEMSSMTRQNAAHAGQANNS